VSLVWFTDGYKTNKSTGAGLYGWGFILGLHTTVLPAAMYTIEACIMENTEKRYAYRKFCCVSDRQVAIKAVAFSK
jgi:hypothetical protein